MTLQDFLILLVAINLGLGLLIVVRLGSVKRELVKLRRSRTTYKKSVERKRGRSPKKRVLPF